MVAGMGADGIDLAGFAEATGRRGVVIASESALFIALQLAEALRESPRSVPLNAIRLTADGAVESPPQRGKIDEAGAVATVADVCELLLKSPPAAVRGLVDRVRMGDIARVDVLCAELEALLVPLNRAAARRVLGRFVRDHQRGAANEQVAGAPSTAPSKPAEAAKPAVRTPQPPAKSTPAANTASDASRATEPSATDTSPDREPPRVDPLPGAARPGQSAVDTEPDAGAGLTAMLAHPISSPAGEERMSNPSLLNPHIPPPPRLGTFEDLSRSSDREPEPYSRDSDAVASTDGDERDEGDDGTSRRPRDGGSAGDTVIEGTIREGSSRKIAPRRNGASVVLAIAIGSLAVALAVLAFALFKR